MAEPGSVVFPGHAFGYDANGNRTSHTWGGATDSYNVASSNNRLNGVSASGSRARNYAHDAAGHRTAETIAGNTINYVYDGFGRPASRSQPAMSIQQSHGATVALPAGTWSYGHDGLGRRTFKRAPGNVLSRYLYGAEGSLLAETSPGGTTLTRFYLWLNGQPIGLVRGGQVYQVPADHLGRPEMLTNSSKAIVWRAENLAFDRKVVTTSIGDYNLGFPGQYYDTEGASWQNWFRTYDGSVGRYTQSDLIGLAGGLNTYAYVRGNPVSLIDALGLYALVCTYPGNGPNVWGHIGIGVGTNPTSTVGYYPESATLKTLTGTPGVLRQDTGEARECRTIETTSEQDKTMQSVIDAVRENPGTYSLTGNNCVSFVRSVLQSIGVQTPNTIKPYEFMDGLQGSGP